MVKMALNNLLYIFFALVFLNGCSHKLTNTKQLDALDKRLYSLEEKIPENILQTLTRELDLKLEQQDKNIEKTLDSNLEYQKNHLESLEVKLVALIKAKSFFGSNEAKDTQTKPVPAPTKTKFLSLKEKTVLGEVEKIHIYPSNLTLDARVDTGAETSSINAKNIIEFERDGKKWVKFTLVDTKTEKSYEIERKITRTIRILQSSLDKKYEKRVAVLLEVTIGDKKMISEFTLADREHMTYPVLIGRNILQDLMIVDVGEQYIAPLVVKEESFKE